MQNHSDITCQLADEKGVAVVFDGVSFAYADAGEASHGNKRALDQISFQIGRGEFCCVLGANGSGKSTLARHIDALLTCDDGAVTVLGRDASNARETPEIRRRVGMVFQDPDDQSLAPLVARDVAFGPENLGLAPAEVEARVEEALAAVGIPDLVDAEVAHLSGGQRQRVAIAGALALRPDILVLDEPGSMLDPAGRARLGKLLCRLRETGMTIVLVTHFMDDISAADHVLVMDRGRIGFDGTPTELVSRPELFEGLALELPFTCRLALKLREQGIMVEPTLDGEELEEELCRLYSTR